MEEEFYGYWLCRLDKITPLMLHRLVEYYGNPKAMYEHSSKPEFLNEKIWEYIKYMKSKEILYSWETHREHFVSYLHEDYPRELFELQDYPFGIFYRGDLKKMNSLPIKIAFVGSRKATPYGMGIASEYAKELAMLGVGIVSGLALGIDTAAHRGALMGDGFTIGVLGTGVDVVYPRGNYHLYEEMERRGVLLSEYPFGTKPMPYNFPRRNRIISVLSRGVFVVEARKKSGSLITADYALEQGRDVWAMPGRPCDLPSAGCNGLIRQGAKLIMEVEDILEEILEELNKQEVRGTQQNNQIIREHNLEKLNEVERIIYQCICTEPKTIDQVVLETNLPVLSCMQAVGQLEYLGLIRQVTPMFYIRN